MNILEDFKKYLNEDKPKTLNDIREIYGLPRIENNIKYDDYWERIQEKDKEIERLNNIINKAREYHDNCINNLLDLDKIEDNERLSYKVAYEIHENYSKILGSEKR